jgi:hypothetical protein
MGRNDDQELCPCSVVVFQFKTEWDAVFACSRCGQEHESRDWLFVTDPPWGRRFEGGRPVWT